jgi:uncharacterized protein (TIGR02147 family)
MENQIYFQQILAKKLMEIKERNPNYSLRSFAKSLDIHPAALSEFINGKRNFSSKKIIHLSQKILLNPQDLNSLKLKMLSINKNNLSIEAKKQLKISMDQYYLVSDWHYYSLLCLMETVDFLNDLKWIAKRLNTTVNQIQKTLKRLIRLNLVTVNKDNEYRVKNIELSTTEDIPNVYLRKRHLENLERAKNSILNDDVLDRDFSFGTIAIDKKKIATAKKMIRNFQNKLFNYLETGEKNEVYEICFQMYPVTNVSRNKCINNKVKNEKNHS